MFKKLFGNRKKISPEEEERLENEWHDAKSALMEIILGKEHNMVMHALIPYEIGGALDLYYFPNGIPGTGIATKELSFACRTSSSNDKFDKYELVMFTSHILNLEHANDNQTPFGGAHNRINSILNTLAPYSAAAKVNPYDTIEFPKEMEEIGGICLIADAYGSRHDGREDFGLMTIIEIYREEMDFARQNGGAALIDLLKAKGHYPYSDMPRDSVLNDENTLQ